MFAYDFIRSFGRSNLSYSTESRFIGAMLGILLQELDLLDTMIL